MTDAILVLNAGSSSLKFSVFLDRALAAPQLALRGQIEGILTKPSFAARDASGTTLAESDLGGAMQPGHQGAAGFLLDWLEQRLGAQRLVAAGHRAVHGGREFSAPVRVSAAVLDALVFTAGIGENTPSIRARVCRAVAWLGIELDESANTDGGPRISRAGSRTSAWVLPTNEELMIALHTRAALAVTA